MAELPKIVIKGSDATAVFHLWSDVQVEDTFEVTNKSGRGSQNSILLTSRLPTQVSMSIVVSDDLTVPTISASSSDVTQNESRAAQIAILRSFVGQVVNVKARTTPAAGVTGVINKVQIVDDGKWDNRAVANVSMQQIQGIDEDGNPLGVDTVFGKITVPLLEADGSTISGGDKECVSGQVRVSTSIGRAMSNKKRSVGDWLKNSWTKSKNVINDAVDFVEDTAKETGDVLQVAFTGTGTFDKDSPAVRLAGYLPWVDVEDDC